MYSIQFLDGAIRDLKKLDKAVARRIVRKLEWLAQHADSAEPLWLRNELAGLAKLREGDFRIIYELSTDTRTILIHFIGHRSEVYKRR